MYDSFEIVYRLQKDIENELKLNSSSDRALAFKNLFHKSSYRLGADASLDRLIGLKMFKRLFRSSKVGYVKFPSENLKSDSAILDGGFKFYDLEVKYSDRFLSPIKLFISKDNSSSFRSWQLINQLRWGVRSLLIVFCSFLSKKERVNRALFIVEFAEIVNLIDALQMNKIKILYDFVPYEKDSDFLTLVLREIGVKHIK
jgi:hypothetical protein